MKDNVNGELYGNSKREQKKMSKDIYSVLVFMSTYNGEEYLEEQIITILNQKNVNIRLLIRDDGSTDNTLKTLRRYVHRYDNVCVIEGENIGFAKSFLSLIYNEYYEPSDYYAFADQDDIWDEDKIISGILLMSGHKNPSFYYSAQRVVDKDGTYLRHETCFRKVQNYSKYSASTVPLTRGCTQIWNSSFHKVLLARCPDLSEIYSHDFWTSLVAFWKADMIYDDVPHMGYRQTGNNVSGTYKGKVDHFKKIYNKALTLFIKYGSTREKVAKQLEFILDDEERILTAHYRDSFQAKIRLIFSIKYKQGIALKWIIFNTILIICNRL